MKQRVLIVEDEEKLRRVVQFQLQSAGLDVDQAGSAEEALRVADRADLILTDLKLPGMDGLQLLARAPAAELPHARHCDDGVRLGGDCRRSNESRRSGFRHEAILTRSFVDRGEKALEVRALRDENTKLREELGIRYQFDNIIGRSPAMQEIFATMTRVAPTRATVLLAGESGVGKDLIARAIHFHSPGAISRS